MNIQRVSILVVALALSSGAFAQKQGDRDRPQKPPNTVVVAPKGERPPPSNNNRPDKNQGGKKGKN